MRKHAPATKLSIDFGLICVIGRMGVSNKNFLNTETSVILTNLVQIPINMAYYILVSPIKISIPTNHAEFTVPINVPVPGKQITFTSCLPQKLCCGLLNCLSLIYCTWDKMLPVKTRDPDIHLTNLSTIVQLSLCLSFLTTAWVRPQKIVSMLVTVNNLPSTLQGLSSKWKRRSFVGSICFAYYFAVFLVRTPAFIRTFNRKTIVLSKVLRIVGRTHYTLVMSSAMLFAAGNVLIFWETSRKFAEFLKKGSSKFVWKNMNSCLKGLLDLAESVNEVIGNIVSCVVVLSVLIMALQTEIVLVSETEPELKSLSLLTMYATGFGVLLSLMADINSKGTQLKRWLMVEENRALVHNHGDIAMMLDYVNSCEISVKAGNAIPITYGLVASVSKVNFQLRILIFFIIKLYFMISGIFDNRNIFCHLHSNTVRERMNWVYILAMHL